jgi:hypothetical protein
MYSSTKHVKTEMNNDTHTHTDTCIITVKKILRQMWSSKVRKELVTPFFSARHIGRLTWSVHFPEFDIKTELCLSS